MASRAELVMTTCSDRTLPFSVKVEAAVKSVGVGGGVTLGRTSNSGMGWRLRMLESGPTKLLEAGF